jgi:hypothetical protein
MGLARAGRAWLGSTSSVCSNDRRRAWSHALPDRVENDCEHADDDHRGESLRGIASRVYGEQNEYEPGCKHGHADDHGVRSGLGTELEPGQADNEEYDERHSAAERCDRAQVEDVREDQDEHRRHRHPARPAEVARLAEDRRKLGQLGESLREPSRGEEVGRGSAAFAS